MNYVLTYYNTLTGLKWSVDIVFADSFIFNYFNLFIDKVMYDMDYIVLTLEKKE